MGFASGVMISASFFSLLLPSIEISGHWFPAITGFLIGAIFLRLLDYLTPHIHIGFESPEGIKVNLKRSTLLMLAITLHNIPEGLSVGVSFGEGLISALSLTLGIGIQNIPEGMAVSMPLRAEGLSKLRSFTYGSLSGVVEPLFAVIGFLTLSISASILPYALAFAAGAMIFVVVEELILESQLSGNTDIATMSAILGFALMMLLDISLR